jgi:glycerol-3-phosphate dehydrogenase
VKTLATGIPFAPHALLNISDSMSDIHVTAIIFGGGVAGLWTLDELRRNGYAAVLADVGPLGNGQTVSSQGILHSGLKYSLSGLLTPSAREARQMPQLWQKCLRGETEPSLVSTQIISDSFLLWGTDSASSRLGMLGAKLGLQVTPQPVPISARPPSLQSCRGAVYRVDEQVIAPESLVASLAKRNQQAIVLIDANHGVEFAVAPDGLRHTMRLRSSMGGQSISISADAIILTAGRGNAALRERLGLSPRAMQTRPLHMVLVRGELPEFHGHCVDGAKTRISITSGRDKSGRVVWQIGGQIAEDGVAWDRPTLIERAQAELAEVMPSLDVSATDWATYRVDRAEGTTATGGRPESFRLLEENRVLTAWPTKLVLAPQLAQALLRKVSALASDRATHPAAVVEALSGWPRPAVALPPWEQGLVWTRCAATHRRAA